MANSCRILLFLSALLFVAVTRAPADGLLVYQLSGGPVSLSFELPVNPSVTDVNLGFDFQVTPINLMINGAPSNDVLAFFNASAGGGFDVATCNLPSCGVLALGGPQFYSGSEDSPTMLSLFDVSLINFDTGEPAGTISTPEPAVLYQLGFGLLALPLAAFALRRHSRR